MERLDILTEVFSTLRLRSEIYFKAELGGRFAVEIPSDRNLVRFHLVLEGGCWVGAGSLAEPVFLPRGGLAVIPNGRGHVMSSRPGLDPVPLERLVEGLDLSGFPVLRRGEGPDPVRLLCGFCSFDEAVEHPVLSHLPEIVVLRPGELGGEPWIAAGLELMARETDLAEQGMRGILSRLLEIVFIQIVRRMNLGQGEAPGYMSALRDPSLSQALLAIHRTPEARWTVALLAREAGMSRAMFAREFAARVGLAPLSYLTNWRLMKARQLLRRTDHSLAEVAARCGYASLPSFSRRFKAAFGTGPGAFRKRG